MSILGYMVGDATKPERNGIKKHVIIHVCNNIGAWGGGFTGALDKKWPLVGDAYAQWFKDWLGYTGQPFLLGQVQFAASGHKDLKVANMIAQNNVRSAANPIPISYPALRICLETVALSLRSQPSVAIDMPRIGCGLAGGEWDKIAVMIYDVLVLEAHIPVFVYDLPK